MIYDKEAKTVLLANLASSEGMLADNAGKATSHVEDYYRVKTYVKPDKMLHPIYPPFPQPYQLGQSLFGGTWNDYNKPFIVQVADCNLDCWYCFVPKELRDGAGTPFTAEQVMDMWRKAGAPRVLRISGGEPTLAPAFLEEMMWLVSKERVLLWIDTNLSTGRSFVNTHMSTPGAFHQRNVALSGCFKGFCNQDANLSTGAKFNSAGKGLIDRQLEMARQIVKETDLDIYFYVPGVIHKQWLANSASIIEEFFHRLRQEVSFFAPLRTYILEVKNYSSTQTGEWDNWNAVLPEGRPIDIWQKLCEDYYPTELLWLPGNQIDLRWKI